MDEEYSSEQIQVLLAGHYADKGFRVIEDWKIEKEIHWRPPLYVKKGKEKAVIDIRISSNITDFWLKVYEVFRKKHPDIDVFLAIPKEIGIPLSLGKKLEILNVGVILVSNEEITIALSPKSAVETKILGVSKRFLSLLKDIELDINSLQPYSDEIGEALTVLRLGQPRNAIGIIGRVLETAITDFLVEANKKHKIHLSADRIASMSFDTKINWLASENQNGRRKQRIISEGIRSKMLSVKWERNIGDHPADKAEVDQLVHDSRAIFELGVSMIKFMKEKREGL